MIHPRIFGIRAGYGSTAERLSPSFEGVDQLPDVPALSETLLLMEIRSRDFCVDLREMSRLVLADMGATLQILRLAAREYGDTDDRPIRIEDCISDLGVQACLDAAGQQTVTSQTGFRGVLDVWAHARHIGHYSRMLAESTDGLLHPEEAYLVGLLHGLGSLPAALGWKLRSGNDDRSAMGRRIAEQWRLPLCVQDYYRELSVPGGGAGWKEVVQTAHEIAPRAGACPLYDTLLPQLHQRVQ